MIRIAVVAALALSLSACQLPPPNLEQSPKQRLISKCDSFYSTLDAALDHNIPLDAIEALEDIEAEVNVICSNNGWETLGMSIDTALLLVEERLVEALAKGRADQ